MANNAYKILSDGTKLPIAGGGGYDDTELTERVEAIEEELPGKVPLVNGQTSTQGISLGRVHERYLGQVTNSMQANAKVDIVLPDGILNGWIEIDVTGGYSNAVFNGRLTKRINVSSLNTSVIASQTSEYVNVSGNIGSEFAISDMKLSGGSRVITVSFRTALSRYAFIFARLSGDMPSDFSQVFLSSVYTDDPTVYPVPEVGHPITWYDIVLTDGVTMSSIQPQYAKIAGLVIVRGLVILHAAGEVDTNPYSWFPPGYRPPEGHTHVYLSPLNETGAGRVINIRSNGSVRFNAPFIGADNGGLRWYLNTMFHAG